MLEPSKPGARNLAQVLMLKERAQGDDPYEATLQAAGFLTDFVAVLEHTMANVDELRHKLSRTIYAGLIITSQRSVDALRSAQLQCAKDGLVMPSLPPCYVVGSSTARALARLPQPPLSIRGTDCGSGSMLAAFIIEQHHQGPFESPLLHLTGDKQAYQMGKALRMEHIDVDELQVYESHARRDLAGAVSDSLHRHGCAALPLWVVFFSPSGIRAIWDTITSLRCSYRLACIGHTTYEFLLEQYGVCADTVAEMPSPDALLRALEGRSKETMSRVETST